MLNVKYFRFEFFSVFILISLVIPHSAQAYIDPGTGSYVLQVLIGVAFGAWFSLKVFGGKIKAFLRNMFSKDDKK